MNYLKQLEPVIKFLGQGFNMSLGKVNLSVTFWEIGSIIFLIFLLVLTMAQFRHHLVDWSLKGAVFGVFFGFLLALILEGFLIIGGKTALTGVLGWKNAPVPLQMALDAGKTQLIRVLGVQTVVPSSMAQENPTLQNVVGSLQSLNPADLKKVKTLLCTP